MSNMEPDPPRVSERTNVLFPGKIVFREKKSQKPMSTDQGTPRKSKVATASAQEGGRRGGPH